MTQQATHFARRPVPMPPQHVAQCEQVAAPLLPPPPSPYSIEVLFPVVMACLAAFAAYLLVTRLSKKISLTSAASSVEAGAFSFFKMVQAFILSKFTWIIGACLGALALAYIWNHLLVSGIAGAMAVVFFDWALSKSPAASTASASPSLITKAEEDVKSVAVSTLGRIEAQLSNLAAQPASAAAPSSPQPSQANPA